VEVVDRREKYQACARSWKRRPDVGADAEYPDLSERDAAAMRAAKLKWNPLNEKFILTAENAEIADDKARKFATDKRQMHTDNSIILKAFICVNLIYICGKNVFLCDLRVLRGK